VVRDAAVALTGTAVCYTIGSPPGIPRTPAPKTFEGGGPPDGGTPLGDESSRAKPPECVIRSRRMVGRSLHPCAYPSGFRLREQLVVRSGWLWGPHVE